MSIILGIDPGSRVCGYGLINSHGSNIEYVACGCIRIPALPFPERLQIIHSSITEIIEKYHPDEVAVEDMFVGKSAGSALKLGQARGVAIVACTNKSLSVAEYAPRKVKKTIIGTGVAEKGQMQQMITKLLSLSAEPQADAADALCIAMCHAYSSATLIKMAGVRSLSRGRFLGTK